MNTKTTPATAAPAPPAPPALSSLTPEAIRAMPAGREMDALITEHIFEWTHIGDPYIDCGMPSGAKTLRVIPHFSTDPTASATILAVMHNLGYYCKESTPFTKTDDYFAGFTPHGMSGFNGRPDYEGKGATLEEARGRAVLLWKCCWPELPPMMGE